MSGVRRVWIALISVFLVAAGVLIVVWTLMDPPATTLWFEVARTMLQVLGVVFLGGIVTIATSMWQHRREQFTIRASLLDRAARCAQQMYVTCQHVARVEADPPPADRTNADDNRQDLTLLHGAYLEFATEAMAIQTEIEARFGRHRLDIDKEQPDLHWHQIYDLLTVYYFSLCRDFRKDVLKKNSLGYESERHSGLTLTNRIEKPRHPKTWELRTLRDDIRTEFKGAVPRLAQTLLAAKPHSSE